MAVFTIYNQQLDSGSLWWNVFYERMFWPFDTVKFEKTYWILAHCDRYYCYMPRMHTAWMNTDSYKQFRPGKWIYASVNWVIIHSDSCPFDSKPLREAIMIFFQQGHWEQIKVQFESKCKHLHSRKCIWKRFPPNVVHFFLDLINYITNC